MKTLLFTVTKCKKICLLFLAALTLFSCKQNKKSDNEPAGTTILKDSVSSAISQDKPTEKVSVKKEQTLHDLYRDQPEEVRLSRAFVESTFVDFLGKELPRLEKIQKSADSKEWSSFLNERIKRSQEKTVTPPESIRELHLLYQTSCDEVVLDSVSRQLKQYAISDSAVAEFLDNYSAVVDKKGILQRGILRDEKGVCKPIVRDSGSILLVAPQLVYRWPGKESSVMGVLDPRNAPYTVSRLWTGKDSLRTHEKQDLVSRMTIEEYESKTRGGYGLLQDANGNTAGWLNLDSCAYWHNEWKLNMEDSKEAFQKGYAFYVHGVWFSDLGINLFGDETTEYEDSIGIVEFDGRLVFDFNKLISLVLSPLDCYEPLKDSGILCRPAYQQVYSNYLHHHSFEYFLKNNCSNWEKIPDNIFFYYESNIVRNFISISIMERNTEYKPNVNDKCKHVIIKTKEFYNDYEQRGRLIRHFVLFYLKPIDNLEIPIIENATMHTRSLSNLQKLYQ
ncbi:MAG: hypothetical protein JW915_14465 [Chitinispirillaceae bacterium]|nr:hypothetical protein [Chitinispirillaceae bacterium]